MEIRRAAEADLERIMELIGQAKAHLKRLGVDQWQSGYPDAASIRADLDAGNGYVLVDGGGAVGYSCISFEKEACYEALQGAWLRGGPYAVLHRTAVEDACKGRGLAAEFFHFAEALCRVRGVPGIRVDTDGDNAAMRNILEKLGFSPRGVVRFDGSDKLAFEKPL